MDLNLLSRFLQELILDYNRISLPGLGCFVIEDVPAYFSEDGNTIFPPNKRVSFKRGESNDDLLAELYQREKGGSESDAKKEISEFVKRFEKDLKDKKNIEIPKFGRMRSTKEGNYFFVADRRIGLFAEDMGLVPISLKVLNQNPQNVLDISEEVSSIVGDDDVPKDTPIIVEDIQVETTVDPVVVEEKVVVSVENKSKGWVKVVIGILVSLAIIIVLFILFREQIADAVEGLLYTEEELELIRNSGI